MARAGHALVGEGGGPIPYQLVAAPRGKGQRLAILASLEPFETKRLRFGDDRRAAATDLRLDETPELIRAGNRATAISIRRSLDGAQGPVAGIRLASGTWAADSTLSGVPEGTGYRARVRASGPVFIELECELVQQGRRLWTMRLRVIAGEPAILVDESFAAANAASFELLFDRGLAPDSLLYRKPKETATWKLAAGAGAPLFVLEPWLHWWESERQGTWFGLFNESRVDLLSVGTREAGTWVDPAVDEKERSPVKLELVRGPQGLRIAFPLKRGERKWLIAATTRDASSPQRFVIKHGDFPLARVNEYLLAWPEPDPPHPRLMLSAADIALLRRIVAPDRAAIARLLQTKISIFALDEPIAQFLVSGDRQLGDHLAATAVDWVQETVDMFFKQDALMSPGYAPHHQTLILLSMNLADVVWSTPQMSEAMRERLRAQMAFLAYTVTRDDYWSHARGFGANPNMSTTVATFQVVLGCMIPSHPQARAWVDRGMRELNEELQTWSGDNGGWLEAPHYALVAYDHMLGAFLAAHHAGFSEVLYDPRMKRVIEWLAKISTPPDPRLDFHRHLPPIGNTYVREATGEFGIVAALWKERDPEFAAQMLWMHRAQGKPAEPGIGGFFPTLAGFRKMLRDSVFNDRRPEYGSERLGESGVMLRTGFGSPRETQLHLIAGEHHDHYDDDSGSFTLWGKGRIVADDFGYYARAPGDDHNMVVSRAAIDAALAHVTAFRADRRADYVRVEKSKAWTRQIVFVKDDDPAGANFFVIRDTVADPATATWRTWFTASDIRLDGMRATVVGLDDVDTDVLIAASRALVPTLEERTRESPGITDGKYVRAVTAQKGVRFGFGTAHAITVVLYPRIRSQPPALLTALAGGSVVKVAHGDVVDYVFVGDKAFSWREEGIEFTGTAGAARIAGASASLWVAAP